MPGVTLPPNQSATISSGLARTERIERRTVTPPRNRNPWFPPFTSPVALTAGEESEPFYTEQNLTITQVRVSLLAAASADHILEVGVSGTPIQQFTLHIGNTTVVTACAIVLGTGSYLTVKAITNTDAKLTVQLTAQ